MSAKASEHPEVLIEIFKQLVRPAPKCSGGAMEVDISQGDLAACMRVSTTFNRYVAPILYDHIITDDPALLLVGLRDGTYPSDRKTRTKAELFALTRHLCLEYPAPYGSLTYRQLLEGVANAWDGMLPAPMDLDGIDSSNPDLHIASDFIGSIMRASDALAIYCKATNKGKSRGKEGRITSPFKLECVSLGAYRNANEVWALTTSDYADHKTWSRLLPRIHIAAARVYFDYIERTNAEHICIYDRPGPLNLHYNKWLALPTGCQAKSLTSHVSNIAAPPPILPGVPFITRDERSTVSWMMSIGSPDGYRRNARDMAGNMGYAFRAIQQLKGRVLREDGTAAWSDETPVQARVQGTTSIPATLYQIAVWNPDTPDGKSKTISHCALGDMHAVAQAEARKSDYSLRFDYMHNAPAYVVCGA